MRKGPFLYVIILSCLAAIIAGMVFFVLKPGKSGEPLKGIPLDASLIIKVNDFQKFARQSLPESRVWEETRAIPAFSRFDWQVRFLDSLSVQITEVNDLFHSQPFYISAHFTGKDRTSLLFVFRMPNRLNEKEISEVIHNLVVDKGTFHVRRYEGVNLQEVNLLEQKQVGNFSFAVVNDVFLLSFSTVVIEDAIRQVISGEPVSNQAGFREMLSAASKNTGVVANIFINFKQFPRSFSTLVKAEYKSEVRGFDQFSDWGEMDMNILPDVMLLNGFVYAADSLISVASLFVNQHPQRITADEVLPSTVSAFVTLSFSDTEKYFRDYRNYLGEQGRLTNYNNTLQSLNNTYHTDIAGLFSTILDNEVTLAFDAGNAENDNIGELVLMRVKNPGYAEEQLTALLASISKIESRTPDSYTYTYRFDSELSFRIRELPIRKFTAKLFGDLFAGLDEHYYIFLDNYLIFSSSRQLLQELISSHLLSHTLTSDLSYRDFRDNLSSRSNILFFCRLSKGNRTFSEYLNPELVRDWEENKGVFEKVQTLGLQLYSSDNKLYSNMLVRYMSTDGSESPTVWESKLDTIADFKPVFVINHNTNQKEVFVQDLSHNIYLINQVGRILWKVKLDEKINSSIYQIDYYNNGKLQLLFSTRNHLYLIDRNGNFVEKFPVNLRSPATCGMSLFDYENNKDYRIFIACENRNVYVYNKEGNLVGGWSFMGTESEVSQPVQHFKVGDRDYIVFGDRFKTYILDRRGNPRTALNTYFQKSSANPYFLEPGGQPSDARLVATDTAGKVYSIYFDGRVSTEDLGPYSDAHFFEYHDLNGDGKNEYIFLEENLLTVYNNDKSIRFTVSFNKNISDRPAYYEFSSTDCKLGIVSPEENLIYLVNNDGTLYSGFPLQGNTPFTIGILSNSASFNLLVGSTNSFLYNYQLK